MKADEKTKRPSKGALLKHAKKQMFVAKKEKVAEQAPVKTVKVAAPDKLSEMASRVLFSPHITEKATVSSEGGVYIFRVFPRANKIMVNQAIREFYGLAPRKINIINVPSKIRSLRGRKGVKPGYKKAIVYFKKGDKIEIA